MSTGEDVLERGEKVTAGGEKEICQKDIRIVAMDLKQRGGGPSAMGVGCNVEMGKRDLPGRKHIGCK